LSSDTETTQLCDLFFELSNEGRLDILRLIEKNPLKLSHIAKELDLAAQEISRQLARLVNVKLVTKNKEGSYLVTSQGRNLLRLLPGFLFLSKNSEYFEKHSLEKLPSPFMGRIGELLESTPVNEIMATFVCVERLMQESEEFFWYITDQNLISANAYEMGAVGLNRGVIIKCIEPVDYSPPEELTKKVPEEVRLEFVEHRKKGSIVDRVLPSVDAILYMNEKEVGILGFPSFDGSFDYLGFTSKDKSFIKWCSDLHEYYWDLGKPRDEFYIGE